MFPMGLISFINIFTSKLKILTNALFSAILFVLSLMDLNNEKRHKHDLANLEVCAIIKKNVHEVVEWLRIEVSI